MSQEEGGKTLPPEAEGAVKGSGSWKKAGRVVAEGTALVEDLAGFLKAQVSEQTERVFAALEDFLSEWAWGKSRRGLFCLLQGAEGVEAPKSFAVRFSLEGGVEARFRFYVREQGAKPCEILGVKLRGDGWELEAEAKAPRKEKPWFSARVGFGRGEREPLSPCEAAETPEGREMVRRCKQLKNNAPYFTLTLKRFRFSAPHSSKFLRRKGHRRVYSLPGGPR